MSLIKEYSIAWLRFLNRAFSTCLSTHFMTSSRTVAKTLTRGTSAQLLHFIQLYNIIDTDIYFSTT